MMSCQKIETLRDNLRPLNRPLQRLKLGPLELPQHFSFSDHHVVYGWPIIKWGFSMLQNRLETIFWCEKPYRKWPELTKNDITKVYFILLWHVDNFLLWGFFKFITRKEPNSGNFRHIFFRNNCSEKIFA